jgi:hypothetical protein
MYETKLEASYQKSYYRKAHVINNDDGTVSLRSYETIVCKYNPGTGEFTRLWGGYSRTTMNHINDFRRLFNLPALNKKAWEALPVNGGSGERYKVEFSNGFVNWTSEVVFDSYESADFFGEGVSEARNWRVAYAVIEA